MNQNVFKPAKSHGGYYLIIIFVAIILLFLTISISLFSFARIDFSMIFLLLSISIAVIFGIFIYGFFGMKYILTADALVIKWGFFQNIIPYRIITNIKYSNDKNYEGIREAGAAVPGFYVGKFRLIFGGDFIPVSLYGTNFKNLLLILTNTGKYYGITPENGDFFFQQIKDKNLLVEKIEVDIHEPLKQDPKISRRNQRISLFFFVLSLVFSAATFICFLYIYPQLKETIPLHFNINGAPDSYGNKSELWIIQIFFIL